MRSMSLGLTIPQLLLSDLSGGLMALAFPPVCLFPLPCSASVSITQLTEADGLRVGTKLQFPVGT